MDIIKQTLIATCSVLLIAIVLDAPKKSLPYAAFTGGIGWLVYLLFKFNNHIVFSTFVAAGVIALLSHVFSRSFKTPTTVFLISALYPFVPGTSVYRAVYALIANDTVAFRVNAVESILISGAIATAVFTIDSLFIIHGKIKKYHSTTN